MENKLILITDDDADIRGELGILLSRRGYQPLLAANGEDALAIYKENKPYVVITDYKMPGMSGLDLLKNLKAINREVIVIMMSGVADLKTTIEAMKADAFDFLAKPIDTGELLKLITASFERVHNKDYFDEQKSHGSFLTHEKLTLRKDPCDFCSSK